MSYQLAARELDSFDTPELEERDDAFLTIVGRSRSFQKAVFIAKRFAARGGANILLCGETGTGKGVFARAVHYAGERPESPFVAVNCAAIPPALLESELFGYERGAFTDAKQTKRGLLELAADGTLFLDEVDGLHLDLQPKLLRALEERRVRRVGGFDEIEVRSRVVAAANRPLENLVEEGVFREDLFYRLNVLRVTIPPLNERDGDVRLLTEHFLREFSEAQGLPPARLGSRAAAALERHEWPGNVRELRNVLEQALVLSDGQEIDTRHLLLVHRTDRRDDVSERDASGGVIAVPASGRTLRSVEAELIAMTLSLAEWNKSAAARILGISRPTLHKKIKEYGLRPIPS